MRDKSNLMSELSTFVLMQFACNININVVHKIKVMGEFLQSKN